jgi:hypothetical protein
MNVPSHFFTETVTFARTHNILCGSHLELYNAL